MHSVKFVLALVLSLLPALNCPLQAREISMLTVEWAPHYGSDLPEKGLTTAIVKAAFKAGGHSSEVDFIPWARALKEVEEGKADIGWGSQIRSYVLDQSRIKDLRTSVETGNTQAVLDGDLDTFIEASLKSGL